VEYKQRLDLRHEQPSLPIHSFHVGQERLSIGPAFALTFLNWAACWSLDFGFNTFDRKSG
jgi:hypothetical protein